MDVEKGSIYELLNRQNQYIVPVYQRKYSWLADVQCARLWKDIVDMEKKGKKHHFVGSIVSITERSTLMGVQKRLIIDGQQRMTTLSILMIALRDYLQENNQLDYDNITNMVLKNPNMRGDEAYKMFLTEADRDILIKLIDKSYIKEDEDSKIYLNYLYFKKKVAEKELTPEQIYNSIAKLAIVGITLDRDQGDDPQLIFECLNSTGMDLSKSDLIRNFILMGLDNDSQRNIYNKYWEPFENYFSMQDGTERMDRFFRDYLTMKKGTVARFDAIYETFKEYASNSEFGDPKELAEDIMLYGDLYTNIISEDKKLPQSQSNLAPLFQEIRSLRMEVAYPLLMKVYRDFVSSLIDLNGFIEIIRLTIGYVVRRAVCEIPTNSLNKTFATFKNVIRNDDYLNSVKANYYYMDSYKRFPTDGEFTKALCERNMYSIRISKYIYVTLENVENKEPISFTGYTIEHILPQNKNMRDEWKNSLGENYEELQAQYVNSFGNLTLTCYNSEMGDRPFAEKVEVYKGSAMHNLNKYVVQQETWNEHTIQERSKLLAQLACHAWEYPKLSDEAKAKFAPKEDSEKRVYDISDYDFSSPFVKDLYDKLHETIMELEPKAKREFRKMNIAYKLKTDFVDVIVQKSKLRLIFNVSFNEIYDQADLCRDVSAIGHWGNGDVEATLDDFSKMDGIIEIVKQSLDRQKQ